MEARVKETTRAVLQDADLGTTTERDIRAVVAQRLGLADVSAHKAAIKSVIEAHLDNLKAEPAPRSEVWKRPYDGDAAEEEEAAHPAAKVARVAGSAGPRSASAAGAGPRTVEGEVDGIVLSEPGATNVRKAAVREWKGHHSVDVREFYVDKSTGELKPSPKGLSLKPAEWAFLVQHMDTISDRLSEKDVSFEVGLGEGSMRRALVSNYGGHLSGGLREFYDAGGEMRPGKKGINLTPAQWDALCQAAPTLTRQLQQSGGAASGSRAGAGATVRAEGAKPAEQSGDDWHGDLGGGRRVTINQYKGKCFVHLREYYQVAGTGEWRPGKKGIALSVAEWQGLAGIMDTVRAAVDARDVTFSAELAPKRRVTVRDFKGKLLVDVREYYGEEGDMKPGAKGLSLSADQWATLEAHAPEVSSRLP